VGRLRDGEIGCDLSNAARTLNLFDDSLSPWRLCRRFDAMRRPLTLLLLLAITLGVTAGPHPCHAQQRQTAPTGHASCHGSHSAPKAPARPAHDCCDPIKGGHTLCDQACQGAAVMGVASTLPEVLAFRELETPVPDSPGALFVLSIDHVPLS